jgi:hypothetical protein
VTLSGSGSAITNPTLIFSITTFLNMVQIASTFVFVRFKNFHCLYSMARTRAGATSNYPESEPHQKGCGSTTLLTTIKLFLLTWAL